MASVYDKYVPSEGLNYIFSNIENCDDSSRPRRGSFDTQQYCLPKRRGLDYRSGYKDSNLWETNGHNKMGNEFFGKLFTHTDKGYVYSFDGKEVVADNVSPYNISQLVEDKTYTFTKDDVSYGQTVVSDETGVLRELSVKLGQDSSSKNSSKKTFGSDVLYVFNTDTYYSLGRTIVATENKIYKINNTDFTVLDEYSYTGGPIFYMFMYSNDILCYLYNSSGNGVSLGYISVNGGGLSGSYGNNGVSGAVSNYTAYFDRATNTVYTLCERGSNGKKFFQAMKLGGGVSPQWNSIDIVSFSQLNNKNTFFSWIFADSDGVSRDNFYLPKGDGDNRFVQYDASDGSSKGLGPNGISGKDTGSSASFFEDVSRTYFAICNGYSLYIGWVGPSGDSFGNTVDVSSDVTFSGSSYKNYGILFDPIGGYVYLTTNKSNGSIVRYFFDTTTGDLTKDTSWGFLSTGFYMGNSKLELLGSTVYVYGISEDSKEYNVVRFLPSSIDVLDSSVFFVAYWGTVGGAEYQSLNTISGSSLTTVQEENVFRFPSIELISGSEYFFYIKSFGATVSHNFKISGQTGDVYPQGSVYLGVPGDSFSSNISEDLYFNVGITKPLFYDGVNFCDDIQQIYYLGGGNFPSATYTNTISSYNVTTQTLTVNTADLNTDFINKYVYIKSGNVSSVGLWASVRDIPSNNEIVVREPFPAGTPSAGDEIIFYNKIRPQLLFTPIRKSSSPIDVDYVYARDDAGNKSFWRLPNFRQLEFYDNRLFGLSQEGTKVTAMNPQFLEQIGVSGGIPLIVDLGNRQCKSIGVFSGFFITFFERSLGIITKKITNQSSGLFVYEHKEFLDLGVYSKFSYVSTGNRLYMFCSDNKFRAVNVQDTEVGVKGYATDEGQVIQDFLDEIVGGDVVLHYVGGTIFIVRRKPDGKETKVFRYVERRKARFVDNYSVGENFMAYYSSFGKDEYTLANNTFCIRSGLTDFGKNITQKIKMYGPVQGMDIITNFSQCKFRLGFDGTPIGGKIRVFGGGFHAKAKEYDIESLDIVKNINDEILSKGLVGSGIFGDFMFGGNISEKEALLRKYPEYFTFSFDNGDNFDYYTIEFYNDTDKNFIFCTSMPEYYTENPLTVSNKGILDTGLEKSFR